MKLALFLIAGFACHSATGFDFSGISSCTLKLDTAGDFVLTWTILYDAFVFKTEVKTLGWAGFGFSKNGTMENADVMISYIDKNGKSVFHVS